MASSPLRSSTCDWPVVAAANHVVKSLVGAMSTASDRCGSAADEAADKEADNETADVAAATAAVAAAATDDDDEEDKEEDMDEEEGAGETAGTAAIALQSSRWPIDRLPTRLWLDGCWQLLFLHLPLHNLH